MEATFAADATKFLDLFQKSQKAGLLLETQEAIKEFALKIPLGDADFWQQLDLSQTPQLTKTLATISKDFVVNQVDIGEKDANRSMQVEPKDFLALVKLLTASDKIAKKMELNLPSLYQNTFSVFLDNNSLHFAIFDPTWALEAAAIKEYWNPNPKEKSFFNFEDYPAGNAHYSWEIPKTLTDYQKLPPELDWVINAVRHPFIQARIAKMYPALVKEDPVVQALQALGWNGEATKTILPSSFFDLAEISFYTNYLLTGLLGTSSVRMFESEFRSEFRRYFQYSRNKDSFSFIRTRQDWILSRDLEMYDFNDLDKKAVWAEFHLKLTASEIFNKEILELFQRKHKNICGQVGYGSKFGTKITERRRLAPNEIGIAQPENLELSKEAIKQINLQQMRHLLGLSSKRELQIQETLGYFKKQPHLLADKTYRDIFNILMFDGGLLLEEMQTPGQTASFLNQLTTFCKQGFEANTQPAAPDLDRAIFFSQINRRFADYVSQLHAKSPARFPAGFKADFFDTRQEIKKLQAWTNLPRKIQHSLHRELVASYAAQPTLTGKDTADFLINSIQLSLFRQNEIDQDTFSSIETRHALRQRHDALHASIVKANGSDILDQVVRAFYPQAGKHAWGLSQFPLCNTKDGAYTIDTIKGRIYANRAQLSLLPAPITSHKAFTDLFKEETAFAAHQIQRDVFEFSDKRSNNYRVSLDGTALILRRRMYGSRRPPAKRFLSPIRIHMPRFIISCLQTTTN